MTESEAIKILQRDLQIQLENKAIPDGIEAIHYVKVYDGNDRFIGWIRIYYELEKAVE